MKSATIMRMVIGLGALLVIGSPRAFAQSEIDPDHFEGPNVEPFDQAKTKPAGAMGAVQYDAKFTLASNAQSNGNTSTSAKPAVSRGSDTRVTQVAMNREGQAVKAEGTALSQARKDQRNALVVENGGKGRQLSTDPGGATRLGL